MNNSQVSKVGNAKCHVRLEFVMQKGKEQVRRLALMVGALAICGSKRLTAQELTLPESAKDALARFAQVKTLSIKWTQQSQPSVLARAKLDAATLRSLSREAACYLVWQSGKMFERRYEG